MKGTVRRFVAGTKPVLVVDDHEDTRSFLRVMLEDEGIGVVEAEHGKAALELLVSRPDLEPCLIVLDLEMPVMSGWEFLAIARTYPDLADIPVVVTSGSEAKSEALDHGAVVDYLAKPVDLRRLLDTVKRHAHAHCAQDRTG